MTKEPFDIGYLIAKHRHRDSKDQEQVALFRGIPKKYRWWKLTVGRWWTTDPFWAYDYTQYKGSGGELYIATWGIKDLIKIIDSSKTTIGGVVDPSGNVVYSCHVHLPYPYLTLPNTLRKVTEEEISTLNSREVGERRENYENPTDIARGIFHMEYDHHCDLVSILRDIHQKRSSPNT